MTVKNGANNMNIKSKKHDPLFYRVGSDNTNYAPSNSSNKTITEKHILKVSIYASLFFAVLGLVWGSLISSKMLIFDGIYSFVSLLMASLSVYVAKIIQTEDDAKFPLGRSQMEPMIIILKALVILVVCIIGFSMAMRSILSGGREINMLSAMMYCLIGIIGCLGCWIYIVWQRKKDRASDLVRAEDRQWLADTLLSVTIFVGFFIAYMIRHIEHVNYSQYADSLMLIISTMFFSVVPIKSLISGIKDMLQMSPGGDVYRISARALEEISKKRGFSGFVLRIVKSGRGRIYKIGLVSDNQDDERSMGELDNIRQEIHHSLRGLYDNPIWLEVSFMLDKKWG
jgi:predicted Co/Zn/Cd cation transporter (cation efflux family)